MADNSPEHENPEDESTADRPTPEESQESQAEGEEFSPEELRADGAESDHPPADVNLDLILDVPVCVSLRIGSTDIAIRDLVRLVEGSVVALDRESTEPVDVLVNGTLIAHGEIVVVDEKFGVRLTDVVSPAERIRNINQA